MKIEFRRGREQDAARIIALMRALEDADPGPNPFDEARRRSCYAQFVKDPSLGEFWLITADSQLVGYVILTFGYSFEYGGRDGFVDEIYVDSKYRGHGIGQQALEFIAEAARKANVRALHLEVTPENRAFELYRRCGYKDLGRRLMTNLLERD